MPISRTTAPTVLPVSPEDVRSQARITATAEDGLLRRYIDAATRYVEEVGCRRQLCTATYTRTQDYLSGPIIVLEYPPLQSVTSIKYRDSAGDQQTVSSADYAVDTAADPGRIVLNYATTWPGGQRGHTNDVEIIFIAGYGDPEDVPETIRQGIILLAAHWFEHREPIITGTILAKVPYSIDMLLWSERCEAWG